MKVDKVLIAFAVIIASGVTLSACREEEQGRPLEFQKGTYGGAPDTQITEETRRKLRARAERMK